MKALLRSFLINVFALWLIIQTTSGMFFYKGYETLFITAGALGLFNMFIKPFLNILLLPINILTLGTLRWLVNVLSLYLMTLIVPGFKIASFHFSGFSYQGMTIPALNLGTLFAFFAFSFILSFIIGFLHWITK